MAALSTKTSRFLVHLPAFDGPLDLLLSVMQARRLDVSLVSLAAITRDFVERVRCMENTATADTADFLVMAAHLVELKARLLLPITVEDGAEEALNSAEELLCRLQTYEKYQTAATFLAERLERGMTEYSTLRPSEIGSAQPLPPPLPTPEAFRAIAKVVLAGRRTIEAPAGAIARAWVTLETCIQSLATILDAKQSMHFEEAIGDDRSIDRVVGTFLAVLHLWKRGAIDVRQSEPYGSIVVTLIVAHQAHDSVAAES